MIHITKDIIVRITEHAGRELPSEACGILAGRDSRVEKAYEMRNADKSSATFFMDGKEQLAVMKEIRSLGLEMVGIYHSHVASRAYPSSHDIEMAFYPEVSYVIISLEDRDKPSVRSFKIVDAKVSEEEVDII